MEDLQFEETVGTMPAHQSMQPHIQSKLRKTIDAQKTPLRSGLGLIVNESKTPGAKSLQSLSSAPKAKSSIIRNTFKPIDFEIFQDDTEDQTAEERKLPKNESEKPPSSPIDTVNRYEEFDSLSTDIAHDMLNWPDRDIVLHEEERLGDYIDRERAEEEALIELGVEEWEEYPSIEPASRIADDFNYVMSVDDFKHENNVKLKEDDYPNLYAGINRSNFDHDEMNSIAAHWLDLSDSFGIDDLLTEEATIPI